MRILIGLLVLACLTPPVYAQMEPDPGIAAAVAKFVQVLGTNDPQAIATLPADNTKLAGLTDLRDLFMKRNACVRIYGYAYDVEWQTRDGARVAVAMHGQMRSLNPRKPMRELHRDWLLELERAGEQWHVRAANQAEVFVAQQLIEATPTDRGHIMAANKSLSRQDLSEWMVWYARGPGYVGRNAPILAYALKLVEGNPADEGNVLRLMATQMMTEGRLDEAVELAEKSLTKGQVAKDADVIASAYFSKANAVWRLGNLELAADLFERSGAMIDQLEKPHFSLNALSNEGHVRSALGDFGGALRVIARLSERSREYGWRDGEMRAAMLRGNAFIALRQFEQAAIDHREVLRLAELEGNDQMAATALGNLGVVEDGSDRVKESVPFFQACLERGSKYKERRVFAHIRLSRAFFRLDDFEASEKHVKLGLAELDPKADGPSRSTLYILWSQIEHLRHNYEAALTHARAAIEEGQKPVVDRPFPFSASGHQVAAMALRSLGRLEEAESELRDTVALIEAFRDSLAPAERARASALEKHTDAYIGLIDMLLARNAPEEALAVAEQLKGRSLRDAVDTGPVDLDASMTPAERTREQELNRRIIDLNRKLMVARGDEVAAVRDELTKARNGLESFRASLYLTRPVVGRRRAGRGVAAAKDLLRLPPDVAAVEFAVGKSATYIFAVTRDGERVSVRAHRIDIDREALRKKTGDYVAAVRGRDLAERSRGIEVYDLLLKPVRDLLRDGRLLCIVPDGVLWELPFHALRMPDGGTLVDRVAVFYAPSLTMLTHEQGRADGGPPQLLAFGNPRVASEAAAKLRAVDALVDLAAIPDAETEVKAIAKLYGLDRSRVFMRDHAREATFKKEVEQATIVHLATHGLVDSNAPMFSALVLAGGDAGEDGLLEAREIADLALRADLVVLSACETARGRVGAGEGVIGLSWAFLAAGCPTTVVSLWKVDSRSTSLLMVELHRGLLAGLPKAEALRQAQRALRSDPRWSHPFYWAPFVVVGEGW